MSTKDWVKSKVAVAFILTNDNTVKLDTVALPNKFTSSMNQNFTKVHGFSEGEYNAGVVREVPTMTWSIDIPANSSSARFLRACMVSKEALDITVNDSSAEDEFELMEERYFGCRVTSMGTNYEIANIPMISFDGMGLRHSFDSKAVDGSTIQSQKEFGDGTEELDVDAESVEWW